MSYVSLITTYFNAVFIWSCCTYTSHLIFVAWKGLSFCAMEKTRGGDLWKCRHQIFDQEKSWDKEVIMKMYQERLQLRTFRAHPAVLYTVYTLWKNFLFSEDVIVILRFWAWNNPLFWPEHIFRAFYGYFSLAQGGNIFRSKKGTFPEIFRYFRNFRRKSGKFPVFVQEEICWLRPLPSPSYSFFHYNGNGHVA